MCPHRLKPDGQSIEWLVKADPSKSSLVGQMVTDIFNCSTNVLDKLKNGFYSESTNTVRE